MRFTIVSSVLVAGVLAAAPATAADTPTFTKDVAPILYKRASNVIARRCSRRCR